MSKKCENMDIEHIQNAWASENVADEEVPWTKFSFCRLTEIHCMDYERISTAVKILNTFAVLEEFYENVNNCLDYTFEFVLTYSSFLVKNADSHTALLVLLDLLQEIISRMNAIGTSISPDDINRILVLLLKLLDSSQQNHVKLAGGKVAAGTIQMLNAAFCDDTNFYLLISRLCTFYDDHDYTTELCRIINAVLKRRADMRIGIGIIIKWLESACCHYLNQDTDTLLLQQLLECIFSYYNTRKENNAVTNTLKGSLAHLCMFMSRPPLRSCTEQLLSILLEELYCTDTIWPGGAFEILAHIKTLPDSYEEWPYVDDSIFFVVAHLLFLHSQLLWGHALIWKSLDRYLQEHIFPQRYILKAVAMLYPVVINDVPKLTTLNSSKILLDILGTCKSLPQLLTYHPMQMTWLLANAKASLKNLVLVFWLQTQAKDEQILKALNATKTGFLLIKFLVSHPDAPITTRVSQLITKLTPELSLMKTIELALPLTCNHPTVFAQLLQVKPTVPKDPTHVLDMIKASSASLPFLVQDAAVQATCSYSLRLLTAAKESNALSMFCHYSASVRFLVVKSTAENDSTALATINLLRQLVKSQIKHGVKINSSTTIHFKAVLRGNFQRILAGLKLLEVLLSCKDRLLLNVPQKSLFSLYHSIHVLMIHRETATMALKVLTRLILLENNLAFSLVTPHTLSLVFKKNIDRHSLRLLLEFLATWLNCIARYSYIEIHVDNLKCFLSQIGVSNDICPRIIQQLNIYEQVHNCKQISAY